MDYSYVRDFRKLGYGMFVHFGLYSNIGAGEWYFECAYNGGRINKPITMDEYIAKTFPHFKVKEGWAKDLCKLAKDGGCRYIALTTRHHEGFSLYDTKGLNEYDAPHSPAGRDLIKEFVEACHEYDILPVFYHTVIDWWHKDYQEGNFDAYFDYLKKSIELLCLNYGPVGGFWFDGTWGLPEGVTFPTEIYRMIHKLQPRAIITNNTGLDFCGQKGAEEIDCVTFERGKAFPVSSDASRPLAGEVCDSIHDHWGYTKDDYCFKSYSYLLNELIDTRVAGCNLLLNVGPKGDGTVPYLDKLIIKSIGSWLKKNHYVVLDAEPSSLQADGATIFEKDGEYYAVVKDVPMAADVNVQRKLSDKKVHLNTEKKIASGRMVDRPKEKFLLEDDQTFIVYPYGYGTSMGARIAKFRLK